MKAGRALAVAAALAASAGFVTLAATRRLNFDEALALRAGVLELAGADAVPAFLMPWTVALGALTRLVPEPGALFLVARLATACALLALLVAAARACSLAGLRLALAVALTLAQRSFVAHGLEFRYDAALLGGLLGLAIALGDRARPRPALAGVALAVIGLHHAKGALLALALAPWAWARLRNAPSGRRRLAAGLAAAGAGWVALVAALGLGGRWLESVREWLDLARGAPRASLAGALGPALLADLAWWSLVALALAAAVRDRLRAGAGPDRGESAALVLGGAALALVLVHPRPWPYMLALPAPFLALVVARRWPEPARRRAVAAWAGAVALALAVQAVTTGRTPAAPWRDGFASPRAPEVEALRRLRAAALPGEAVLDPSGLAYFLPPCTREWYTDTLFAQRPGWMAELAAGVPARCTWVLHTYRLEALPAAARRELGASFVLTASGLALRRGDERIEALAAPVPGLPGRIESYW